MFRQITIVILLNGVLYRSLSRDKRVSPILKQPEISIYINKNNSFFKLIN